MSDFLHHIVGLVDPEDTGEPPEDWLYYFTFGVTATVAEQFTPCGSQIEPINSNHATTFVTELVFGISSGESSTFAALQVAERLPDGSVGETGSLHGPGVLNSSSSGSVTPFSGQEWATRLFGVATVQFRAEASANGSGIDLAAYCRQASGDLTCRWWPIPAGFLATLSKESGGEAEMGSFSWDVSGSTFSMNTPSGPRNFVYHSVGPLTIVPQGGFVPVWMEEVF